MPADWSFLFTKTINSQTVALVQLHCYGLRGLCFSGFWVGHDYIAVLIVVVGSKDTVQKSFSGCLFGLNEFDATQFVFLQVIAPRFEAGKRIVALDQMPILAPKQTGWILPAITERVRLRSRILHSFPTFEQA